MDQADKLMKADIRLARLVCKKVVIHSQPFPDCVFKLADIIVP
jgi:hypothetical protein